MCPHAGAELTPPIYQDLPEFFTDWRLNDMITCLNLKKVKELNMNHFTLAEACWVSACFCDV